MKFPLQAIPREYARWPLLALLLAVSLWLGSRAGGEGRLHNTAVAPEGVVSLERAADPLEARKIISFWDRWEGRKFAIETIEIDFIFLIFYSTTLALACVIAADRLFLIGKAKLRSLSNSEREAHEFNGWIRLGNLGILLAWGQWVAAALDAAENEAILTMLRNAPTQLNTTISWICADLKFGLIAGAIIYASLGVLTYFGLTFFKPQLVRSPDQDAAEAQAKLAFE